MITAINHYSSENCENLAKFSRQILNPDIWQHCKLQDVKGKIQKNQNNEKNK